MFWKDLKEIVKFLSFVRSRLMDYDVDQHNIIIFDRYEFVNECLKHSAKGVGSYSCDI